MFTFQLQQHEFNTKNIEKGDLYFIETLHEKVFFNIL